MNGCQQLTLLLYPSQTGKYDRAQVLNNASGLFFTSLSIYLSICTIKHLWQLIYNNTLEKEPAHSILSRSFGWSTEITQRNIHVFFPSGPCSEFESPTLWIIRPQKTHIIIIPQVTSRCVCFFADKNHYPCRSIAAIIVNDSFPSSPFHLPPLILHVTASFD